MILRDAFFAAFAAAVMLTAGSAGAVVQEFDFTAPSVTSITAADQPFSVTADNGLVGKLSALPVLGSKKFTTLVQRPEGSAVGNIIQEDEVLRFVIPSPATITMVTVWEQGAIFADTLALFVDGVFKERLMATPNTITPIMLAGGGYTGSVFDFIGENTVGNSTTAYRVTGLKIDDPSVIPLPAAAPLLLGGLAALGVAARRRRG